MNDAFAQVRAIVDARIHAWREACEQRFEARRAPIEPLTTDGAVLPECECCDCEPRMRGDASADALRLLF